MDAHEWMMSQVSDKKVNGETVLLLTELLYNFCGGDPEQFAKLCDIVGKAYDAGKDSA